MSSISKQISAVAHTSLSSPLTVINAFSKTAFGSMEKLIALNINTVKQSLESSAVATRQLFSARKPEELLSYNATHAQPHIEKIMAYGRELADISAHARAEFLQVFSQSGDATMAPFSINISEQVLEKKTRLPVATSTKAPVKKAAATANTQLPLLAEPELKTEVKKAKKSTEKKSTAKPSTAPAEKAPAKATTAAPAVAASALAAANSVQAQQVSAPADKVDTTTTVKTTEPKQVAIAPEIKVTVPAPEAKPVAATAAPIAEKKAEKTTEKKAAVKLPFPASPAKKTGKPSFPAVSTRPAYKAKGSAATGAKKPVRQ